MKLLKMFAELTLGKVIIMAIFATAIYYASYFDPGTSVETEVTNIETQITSQAATKTEFEKILKKEEEMKGNVLQLRRNLEVVKSKIPAELKDAQMQGIINEAAVASGVSVTRISSQNDNTKDPNAPPLKIPASEIKPENLIEEVKFLVSINGTFEAFLKFLDSLAREDKVIKVRNFTIKKASDNVDEDKIIFDGTIVGFKQANIVTDLGPSQ